MEKKWPEELDSVLAPYMLQLQRVIKKTYGEQRLRISVDDGKTPLSERLQVNIPKIEVPKIEVPKIEMPPFPEIKIPKIDLPTIVVPPITVPPIVLPTIHVPKPEVTVIVNKVKVENFPTAFPLDDRKILEALKRLEQKPSGGGGGPTEYKDATGYSSIGLFGQAPLWDDGGTMRAVSATKPLPVTANSYDQVDLLYSGTTSLTPTFATLAASASGNTQIVAGTASKKILVLALMLSANGTVNVKFQSATTDVTGLMYLIANTGYVLPYNPKGWWRGLANADALNINLSAAIAVGGQIVYVVL